MLGVLLTTFTLGGYWAALNRFTKIPFQFIPFFTTSLLGVILFLAALSSHLTLGTSLIIYLGCSLAALVLILHLLKSNRRNGTTNHPFHVFLFFALVGIGFLYAHKMMFSVIDDYVYWGILGKYLYANEHLPDSQTTIIARHLSYTPGTGLFLYLGYSLFSSYSEPISYFFQNILFVSALFTLTSNKRPKESLLIVSLILSLSILFSGSVLAKLSVDFLLSAYFCAVLWIFISDENLTTKLISISPPLIYLFLIKEIGLFLCLSLLITYTFYLVKEKNIALSSKILAIGCLAALGAVVFSLKSLWLQHCANMGFGQFSSSVTPNSMLDSLKFFASPERLKGAKLFLKSISFGPADRLHTPYIVWYGFMLFLYAKVISAQKNKKSQVMALFSSLLFFFFVYLVMLYFLQIIVFSVGSSFDHTIGMTRYVNIYFSGFTLFLISFYLKTLFKKKHLRPGWLWTTVLITVLLLFLSRAQRLEQETTDIEIEKIAEKISASIPINSSTKICAVPNVDPDELIGIKLTYHLLPAKINTSAFPVSNYEQFKNSLSGYDYCLFYKSPPNIANWLKAFSKSDIFKDGFYQVLKDKNSIVKLEKIF